MHSLNALTLLCFGHLLNCFLFRCPAADEGFGLMRTAGYIHLYGLGAQLHLASRISQLETQRSDMLGKMPEGFQQKVHKRMKEAAVEPGAEKWVFPQPILDEVEFRERIALAASDTDS